MSERKKYHRGTIGGIGDLLTYPYLNLYVAFIPGKACIEVHAALDSIIIRGIERSSIFRDDSDKDRFLKRFGNILGNTKIRVSVYL